MTMASATNARISLAPIWPVSAGSVPPLAVNRQPCGLRSCGRTSTYCRACRSSSRQGRLRRSLARRSYAIGPRGVRRSPWRRSSKTWTFATSLNSCTRARRRSCCSRAIMIRLSTAGWVGTPGSVLISSSIQRSAVRFGHTRPLAHQPVAAAVSTRKVQGACRPMHAYPK